MSCSGSNYTTLSGMTVSPTEIDLDTDRIEVYKGEQLGDYPLDDDADYIVRVTVRDDDGVIDLSAVTTKQFIFYQPDGTTQTVNASFCTDGTDGILYYELTDSDLDTTGTWYFRVYIDSEEDEFYTETASFQIT